LCASATNFVTRSGGGKRPVDAYQDRADSLVNSVVIYFLSS
jgi:hypothetical protein